MVLGHFDKNIWSKSRKREAKIGNIHYITVKICAKLNLRSSQHRIRLFKKNLSTLDRTCESQCLRIDLASMHYYLPSMPVSSLRVQDLFLLGAAVEEAEEPPTAPGSALTSEMVMLSPPPPPVPLISLRTQRKISFFLEAAELTWLLKQ